MSVIIDAIGGDLLPDFREDFHTESNRRLWERLPRDQIDRVFATDLCDIDPEFLGFVHIYDRLAELIPRDWTVVDLGCAYAPQSFFFDQHAKYIGVDFGELDRRFAAPNTEHFALTIREFIDGHISTLSLKTTFAICSYVPPWGDDNAKLACEAFTNVFAFYPCSVRNPTT